MKLDKRIESIKSIRSFNTDNSDCSGKVGYFTNYVNNFDNLDDVCKGTCIFEEEENFPFYAINTDSLENRKFQFFIPEEDLLSKPKEKKFRPYTLKEFFNKFTVGQPIRYRKKGDLLERYLILEGYVDSKGDDKENRYQYIHIGSTPYSLDELFNKYEWQERYTEEFQPFGVEE